MTCWVLFKLERRAGSQAAAFASSCFCQPWCPVLHVQVYRSIHRDHSKGSPGSPIETLARWILRAKASYMCSLQQLHVEAATTSTCNDEGHHATGVWVKRGAVKAAKLVCHHKVRVRGVSGKH